MDFITEAGAVVYPVLLAGFASIAFAARYARGRRDDDLVKLVVVALLCLALGTLGCVTGLQASAGAIATVSDKWLFLIGLREALHNLVLALCFVCIDLLVLAFVPRRPSDGRQLRAAGVAS